MGNAFALSVPWPHALVAFRMVFENSWSFRATFALLKAKNTLWSYGLFFDLSDFLVRFFKCPCNSRHSSLAGWTISQCAKLLGTFFLLWIPIRAFPKVLFVLDLSYHSLIDSFCVMSYFFRRLSIESMIAQRTFVWIVFYQNLFHMSFNVLLDLVHLTLPKLAIITVSNMIL